MELFIIIVLLVSIKIVLFSVPGESRCFKLKFRVNNDFERVFSCILILIFNTLPVLYLSMLTCLYYMTNEIVYVILLHTLYLFIIAKDFRRIEFLFITLVDFILYYVVKCGNHNFILPLRHDLINRILGNTINDGCFSTFYAMYSIFTILFCSVNNINTLNVFSKNKTLNVMVNVFIISLYGLYLF